MNHNQFVKSHALGNDYIVLEPDRLTFELKAESIRRICDRNHGVGSDGILALTPAAKADFGVRIFNPDGSEAEKSGNGLRIFAKFLYDHGHASNESFSVATLGGIVTCTIFAVKKKVQAVRVDMGIATFQSQQIPVTGAAREVLNEPIEIGGRHLRINAVGIGNPHCVVFVDKLEDHKLLEFGPSLEHHALFPHRTNVQFAQIISHNLIRARIWERGAGHTLASGSSACAVAAAAVRRGLVDRSVTIEMEGGSLQIEVSDTFRVLMSGPASEICTGSFSEDLLASLSE